MSFFGEIFKSKVPEKGIPDPYKIFGEADKLFFSHEYEKAIILYNKAISIKPDFLRAFFSKGICLKMLDRFDESISVFNDIIDKISPEKMADPDIERIYYLSLIEKGQAHNSIGQYQQAISTANIVLNKYPDQYMALEIMGDALDKEKNYKEAVQYYDKILLIPNLNPDIRHKISIKKNSTKFMQFNSK